MNQHTTEYSECVWCLNCAYAIVPHLRDSRHTFAVYCRCYAGRAERDRHTDDRRSMTLDDYERRNPGWQERLKEKP